MPIYDQTFRRYEGTRSTRALWWPVARNTINPVLKNKLTWALFLMLLIAVVVVSVGFFAAAKVAEVAPHRAEDAMQAMQSQSVPLFGRNTTLGTLFHQFLTPMFSLLGLLLLVTGSGSISRDLRSSALPLYFSRPLKPWQYAFGKIIGLSIVPVIAMTVALLLLYFQFIAYFGSGYDLLRHLPVFGAAVVQVILTSVFLAIAITAFSSMTKTAGTAAVLYLGFLMLTFTMAQVFAETQNAREFRAMAPRMGLSVISRALLKPELQGRQLDQGLRLTLAVCSLLSYAALFLFILRRNLRVVEVVK